MYYQTHAHPLVQLRRTFGLQQKELAAIAGFSIPMLQAIESGRRQLQEKHAAAIAVKTGVGFNWLLRGEAKGHVLDFSGRRFTKEAIKRLRAELRSKPHLETDVMMMKFEYLDASWRLARSIVAACEKGDQYLCAHRISEFARALEIGHDVQGSVKANRLKLGHNEPAEHGGTAWTPDIAVIWEGFVAALEEVRAEGAHDNERRERKRSGRHNRKTK
jgi:transcriptional regulator with XRE-family HTH domain